LLILNFASGATLAEALLTRIGLRATMRANAR
jgi:hypothetical protein